MVVQVVLADFFLELPVRHLSQESTLFKYTTHFNLDKKHIIISKNKANPPPPPPCYLGFE